QHSRAASMAKADQLIGLDTPTLADDPDRPPKRYVHAGMVIVHALAMLAAAMAAAIALYLLECNGTCSDAAPKEGAPVSIPGGRLLLVAMVSGTLGGLVHAISSFTDFAGNRQLLHSWIPWLYLRAPVGALLATMVYLVLQTTGQGLTGSCCTQLHTVALAGS